MRCKKCGRTFVCYSSKTHKPCFAVINNPNYSCVCDDCSTSSKGQCVTTLAQAEDKKVIGGYRVLQRRC